jgi:hypothetical protein
VQDVSDTQLIDARGVRTPLKPMHFSPTSRMSSAIATPSLSGFDELAALKRASIESGEFIVIVAAVERASHDGRPSFCACASCSILLYKASMLRGAGIGPGRACAALMRALRLEDSLDIVHH